MKTQLPFAVSLLLLAYILFASRGECQTLFSKEIAGSYSDCVSAASLLSNNSAIVFAGSSQDLLGTTGSHGTFVGKMDTTGNLLWDRILDPGRDRLNSSPSCILERSYGYLIGGSVGSRRNGFFVMKIDGNGNFIDYHKLQPKGNGAPVLRPQSMTFRPDGALIMAGYGGRGYEHSQMIWIKTDETFSSYSVKQVGTSKDLTGVRIFAEPDNSSIVACTTGNLIIKSPGDNGSAFPTLIKMDADGNVLFTKNYKMSFYAALYDCIRISDGSFILIGSGVDSSFIEKISSSYEVDWFKSYPIGNKYPTFESVSQTSDGGFLIGGNLLASNNITINRLLMKTNASGDATSYLTINESSSSSESDRVNNVFPVSSTQYLGIGYNDTLINQGYFTVNIFNTNANLGTACPSTVHATIGSSGNVTIKEISLTSSNFSGYLYEYEKSIPSAPYATASDWCAPLREENVTANSNETIGIIPNPASGELTIQLPLNYFTGIVKVEIVNMVGQEVANFQWENTASFNLNVGQWRKGNYLVKLMDAAGRSLVTKLQVQ